MLFDRYVLHEKIGAGGMGEVYRATDRLTSEEVALKRVLVGGQQARSDSRARELRLALAREFQTLAALRHPNIISVLDYGFDDREQPYFTMDYLPQATSVRSVASSLDTEGRVGLLVEVLQALAYLHRRDILHRDLKPGNVLVADNRVRVLDFGLSVHVEESEGIAGTLAYMAPEVLTEGVPSRAADLYAVGVIAYELLAGRHPYVLKNRAALVKSITSGNPDLRLMAHLVDSGVRVEGVEGDQPTLAAHDPEVTRLDLEQTLVETPAVVPGAGATDKGSPEDHSTRGRRLAAVVGRLMARNPEERYSEAGEVIAALCAAVEAEPPPESTTIREAFLQAAEFVGRDDELGRLTEALAGSIEGRGCAWLVGGESGVGKSRLMDELRTQALVRGAVAVRGQSVADGRATYQVWRDPARYLSCTSELTDDEASVLKVLVPDLERLLERPVGAAPELDVGAAQERLLGTLSDLLTRQPRPLLLLLEDLQWAGESLNLIRRLVRRLRGTPVMVVGTFRIDERPDLPEQLPGMELLELRRFGSEQIARLSASMLGEAGAHPRVVHFLESETEGNIFFLVEVVRALAEEAGSLDRISSEELPESVTSGGIARIIQRRLDRVPEKAVRRLRLASVLGRAVDVRLLAAARDEQPVSAWLEDCAAVAVLEVQDNQWRFAHDKLREALVAKLQAGERVQLHREAAELLESVYRRRAPAAALAHQWRQAGEEAREAPYSRKAGELAFSAGAYLEAIEFLERALELSALQPEGFDPSETEWLLGEAYFGVGNMVNSRRHLENASRLLGICPPSSGPRLALTLARQAATQTAHRMWPARFVGTAAEARQSDFRRGSRIHERLGHVHYSQGNSMESLCSSLTNVNCAERAGPSAELARAYATQIVGAGMVPLHGLAARYRALAEETLRSVRDPASEAWTKLLMGVYLPGLADWKAGQQALREAVELYERLGDKRRWEESTFLLAYSLLTRGKMEESEPVWQGLLDAAYEAEDHQATAWGLIGRAEQALVRGNVEAGRRSLREARSLARGRDWVEEVWIEGAMARLEMSRADVDGALEAAENAARLAAGSNPTAFYTLTGYAGPAEVFLWRWQQEVGSGGRGKWRKPARAALRRLRNFARIFPVGGPTYQRLLSELQRLDGPGKALDSCLAGLEQSRSLEVPAEEAQLLALHAELDPGRSLDSLNRAFLVCSRHGFDLIREEVADQIRAAHWE